MKPFNKRKASKVTFKSHHKHRELPTKEQLKRTVDAMPTYDTGEPSPRKKL